MAFVYKAERNIVLADTEDARSKNRGPGLYQAEKPLTKQYHSRPPFQTQTGREGKAIGQGGTRRSQDFGEKAGGSAVNFAMNMTRGVSGGGVAQKTQYPDSNMAGYTPGPGSYNVTNGFDQIHRDMQSAKTLQGFGLDQFGIQFVKPNTSFASRVKRFQGGELGPKSEAPGPGYYNQESQWVKKHNSNQGWNKGMVAVGLQANAPSIPSHNNVFGYEENARGELIRQKNSEQVHTGVKEDRVGPGEYQLDMKKTTKGPTKWVKSDVPEKIQEIKKAKTGVQPGPGHYQPPISSINPIYKNNKSSVFASRVPRSSASAVAKNRVKVVPKQSVPQGKYHAIAKAAASPKGVQDILESDDDDTGPGPGQYYDMQQSNFKPETKPQRLQFFGSTVERFNESNRFKVNDEIGPTTYSVQNGGAFSTKSIKPGVRQKRNDIGFQSGQARFQGSKSAKNGVQKQVQSQIVGSAQKMITPGPGHYDESNQLSQQVMRKTYGKDQFYAFGYKESKAPTYNVQETPGPGQYAQANLEAIKRDEIKRSSSMFISKTKRNNGYYNIVKKTKQNPGLERVCYDDKVNTIGDVVKRRVDQVNNPLLASLTTKNNTTMAFSSNAPRFNEKIMDEETYIGPGYYEQKSCFEKSRSTLGAKTKSGQGQPNLQNARSMQMIVAQQQAAKLGTGTSGAKKPNASQNTTTPGPGHYSQPDLNRWFKRSYNMNFSEV